MDILKVTRDMYNAFGRGDIEAILGSIAEDVDWGGVGPALERSVPWLRNGRGHDAVSRYFAGVAEHMKFSRFSPRAIHRNGNDVIAAVDVEFMVSRTGKRAELTECHHFTYSDNGMVIRYRLFVDEPAVAHAFSG